MKFGRRQGKEQGAEPGVADAPPAGDPAEPGLPAAELPADPVGAAPDSPFSASWTAPPDAPPPPPPQTPPPPPPPPEPEPYAAEPPVAEEPVVEGEAFELFTDEPPAVEVTHHVPPPQPPEPMPFPVAEQPVAVVTPDPVAPPVVPVTTLGDAGEAFASGHAEMPSRAAGPGPSWQEPVMELANERPELVVAAAFAGGLVAALILRRLGS